MKGKVTNFSAIESLKGVFAQFNQSANAKFLNRPAPKSLEQLNYERQLRENQLKSKLALEEAKKAEQQLLA